MNNKTWNELLITEMKGQDSFSTAEVHNHSPSDGRPNFSSTNSLLKNIIF